MGYNDTPHNYQVYLPSHRMTIVCRDVKFVEDKVMSCSLEREIWLHKYEEVLAPKEEPQNVVEHPQAEEQRVEAPTHAETSGYGR